MFLLLIVNIITKFLNSNEVNDYNIKISNQDQYLDPKSKNIKSTGMCGTSLNYSIENDKLIIKGSGDMTNYNSNSKSPFYSSIIKEVELPELITSIGSNAFYMCKNLQKITIPNNVILIGSNAFAYCSSLQNVTIPPKVTTISYFSFHGCIALSIEIHDNVTSIEYNAFGYCLSFRKFTIPPKVTSISYHLFEGCSNLLLIEIHDNVTSIEFGTFQFCTSLPNFTIPPKVTSISAELFDGCSNLSSIKIHDDVTSIDFAAFRSCISLQSIIIPPKISVLPQYVFYKCSNLLSIEIQGNLTFIGKLSFANCSNLNYVFYNGSIKPSNQTETFLNSPIDMVYVTQNYESDIFCELPVRLLPTTTFSMSEIFTKSNIFDYKNKFTESNLFSESSGFIQSDLFNRFTKSNLFNENSKFAESNLFNESYNSITNSQNTFFYSNKIKYSISLTLSLTFVQRRSVSFSLSIMKSNTYYITYDDIKDEFINIIKQSDYQIYIPYIIYYYSPINVTIDIKFYINRRKGLTGEQLIGIICGSTAVFFILIYIIILINWKKIYNVEENSTKWYKILYSSSSSSIEISNDYQQNQINLQEGHLKSIDDDFDLDFWL